MTRHSLRQLFAPRAATGLVLAASVIVLATVFAMQHFGGLAPCPLCIAQRWPYAAATAFALGALAPGLSNTTRRVLLGLAGVAFLTTAGIGFYHAGVELRVFDGPSACSGTGGATTLDALREQLRAQPVIRCDEVPWALFGISLAGWNFVVASGLAAFALGAAARRRSPG